MTIFYPLPHKWQLNSFEYFVTNQSGKLYFVFLQIVSGEAKTVEGDPIHFRIPLFVLPQGAIHIGQITDCQYGLILTN